MGFLDFLLFPIYVLLFHLFFASRRKKIKDPVLRFYHKYGFWAKVLATFAITIFNLYLSPGDSTNLYYPEGRHLFRLVLQDPSNLELFFVPGKEYNTEMMFNNWNAGYFGSESNVFVIRLVAFFSFFTFGRYLLINLFFSMVAFSGIWKLFKFFYEIYPHLHKQISIAILFLPTLLFWSSGILKDPICMGMLGWLTYSIYKGFYKKENPMLNAVISLAAVWVLTIVKPYIIFAYLPFFILYLFSINLNLVKSTLTRAIMVLVILIFGVGGFVLMSEKLMEAMGTFSIEKINESVLQQQSTFASMADRAESSFTLGVEFDGSTGSLLRMAPAAINATLFRPYLWESKKISTLLSSLESLTLMLLTLFVLLKSGVKTFFSLLLKDPMVTYCFFFSVLFALFVGATTLNFGTLVRYKIPCMPFYIMALLLIYDKSKKRKVAMVPQTPLQNVL